MLRWIFIFHKIDKLKITIKKKNKKNKFEINQSQTEEI